MHSDMYPFFPLSETLFLSTLMPYSVIFYGCLMGVIMGGIGYLLRRP